MDKPLIEIMYKTANGERICVDVSADVKNLLEQTNRQTRSQRRKDRRYLDFVESVDELGPVLTSPQEDIADLVSRMDSYNWLHSAIMKLSDIHRRRIFLYYFCNLTCREIADIEDANQSTVSRSLRQALKVLKTI